MYVFKTNEHVLAIGPPHTNDNTTFKIVEVNLLFQWNFVTKILAHVMANC